MRRIWKLNTPLLALALTVPVEIAFCLVGFIAGRMGRPGEPSRRGCNPRVPWVSSLSLGRRLTMRTPIIIAFSVSLLGVTSCSRFSSSGIPASLNSDTPMLMAGHAQGIKLAPGSSGEEFGSRYFETERRFYTTLSSGKIEQLLAAYRREIEHIMTSAGAEIRERGITGTSNNVQDFSFGYTWGGTDGIVRVFSFTSTNNEAQIVMVCYEHQR
jgi:hypothetical protein